MKKSVKIVLWILFIIMIAYAVIFTVDYSKVSRLKKPLFVIEAYKEDGGTSLTVYRGLGYTVKMEEASYVEENIEKRNLCKTEMYMFNKFIVGAVADLNQNDNEPNKDEENNNETNNTEITTVMTLDDNIQNDTIWCGTFQLIWNDLKNDLAKQDIVFDPQLEVVENLNKETFKEEDLSEKYYYKTIGNPTYKLKEQIEKEIKKKFNEKSDILDDFEWNDENDEDYFLYVMLKKQFEFEKAFEEFEEGKFGNTGTASYFGIKEDSSSELRDQIGVLYYNSKDDFAIILKTKQEDEVIICKNPNGNNFSEIYNNIEKQTETYEGITSIEEGEIVKIPDIKLKEKKEFEEIQEKSFAFSNGETYSIKKAMQTIEFELDKTGGKIKSEAGMMVQKNMIAIVQEKREFIVDDTFAIFLREEGKEKPYFAGKIDDITKFQ